MCTADNKHLVKAAERNIVGPLIDKVLGILLMKFIEFL